MRGRMYWAVGRVTHWAANVPVAGLPNQEQRFPLRFPRSLSSIA
jgi:hypothetical protein